MAELLGPFDTVQVCPHGPGRRLRLPQAGAGMVLRAAAELGVAPCECVVVGDIGADVEAALAAGARAVLVPTPVTRREEVAAAPVVAADLAEAVEIVLALAQPCDQLDELAGQGRDHLDDSAAAPGEPTASTRWRASRREAPA